MTGVVGPLKCGDAVGSCGQCSDALLHADRKLMQGWTSEMVGTLYDVWDRWHLNDMRAGSPRQEELLRDTRLAYEDSRELLAQNGLLHDTEFWWDYKERKQYVPTEYAKLAWGSYYERMTEHSAKDHKRLTALRTAATEIDDCVAALRVRGATFSYGTIEKLIRRASKATKRQPTVSVEAGVFAALCDARPTQVELMPKPFMSFKDWLTARAGGVCDANPDARPYLYGSAHIFEPIPQDVYDFLVSLPDAGKPHPWA